MRIVHLSDSHLGYSGFGVQHLVDDPHRPGVKVKQQEADLQRGLQLAIDQIIQEVQPDVVVHSGDIFEISTPSASALAFAMNQFWRLSNADIPVLVVEGNHSCPRVRNQGHILTMLGYLPGIQVVCGETQSLNIRGIRFHAVPHRAALQQTLVDESKLDGRRPNVLITHGVADGLDIYRTGRLAAHLDIQSQAKRFDYIALGHYHRFGQISHTRNAFYAGSTAMVSTADFRPGYEFGFNIVELAGEVPVIKRGVVKTRPMHPYGIDNAEGLSAEEILDFLVQQTTTLPPKEAYCRVVIEGVEPRARQMLSNRKLEELFTEAAAIKISMRVRETKWDAVAADLLSGGSPELRFEQLVNQMDGEPNFKQGVQKLGMRFLNEVASRIENEQVKGSDGDGEEAL